jgi:type IV fimbrial biogenesis protein FimT
MDIRLRAAPAHRQRSGGFTLVEMMVVVAVLVALLASAGPAMSSFATANQLAASKTGFAGALALARSEAAKRGSTVILAARGTAATGNELGGGWDIVVDSNGNGSADTGDTLVRRFDALPAGVRLSGDYSIVYRATGYLATAAGKTYTVCRASGSHDGYQVSVTASGVTDIAAITSCP